MRPRPGRPLSACASARFLFWVPSVYPLQVMPDTDKRPPLPARPRCLDLHPGVSGTVTIVQNGVAFSVLSPRGATDFAHWTPNLRVGAN